MKIKMLVELDYDAELIHGNSQSGIEWFRRDILLNASPPLLLHSNDIGEQIGEVKVLEIIEGGISLQEGA